MKSSEQNCGYWPLDYDWSKRGGQWNEFTDVMLIGEAQADACSISALVEWVRLQQKEQAAVDGQAREIFYVGGVRGYLQSTSSTTTIFLHSHGEDAFDSLSYYSKEIFKFLRSRGCISQLNWTEARHDRADHQLQWP